ncbi:MAG: CRISPR-associated endonuclease Cas1, partial [Deltaproteobacteria bacterium]
HQPRYGHAALASDLIEEFRSIVVDSTVLTVVKKRMIKPEHFRNREGKLEFSRVGIRKFLHALDATFQRQVVLGGVGIRVSYQKAIEFQARQIVESVLTGQVSYQPVLPGKRPR